jgi:hypothetical protein
MGVRLHGEYLDWDSRIGRVDGAFETGHQARIANARRKSAVTLAAFNRGLLLIQAAVF